MPDPVAVLDPVVVAEPVKVIDVVEVDKGLVIEKLLRQTITKETSSFTTYTYDVLLQRRANLLKATIDNEALIAKALELQVDKVVVKPLPQAVSLGLTAGKPQNK